MWLAMNWREKWCLFWHRTLRVVERYPGSDHAKCDKCGCEFGINHSVRVCLPWREVADQMTRIRR